MKVVIDRAKWNSGKRYGEIVQLLLPDTGTRCCLGFLGQACGLLDCYANRCFPSGASELAHWPQRLFDEQRQSDGCGISWEDVFVVINDMSAVDDATREAWIATGFREVLGCEVEFVGEYPRSA